MCIGGSSSSSKPPKVETPAAAPAPVLPAADVPIIGDTRQRENKRNFGKIDGPSYRIRNDAPQA